MSLNEPLNQQISGLVTQNPIVLFMKGTRYTPQCGFSAKIVNILDELQIGYETVDVLRSPEIRDGIKAFSEWPTIPQLYVNGQFVGGSDIVSEMHGSGGCCQSNANSSPVDATRAGRRSVVLGRFSG